MNPYDWSRHILQSDAEVVRRMYVSPIVTRLKRGEGVVIVAGHGMGKSVLLRQIRANLDTNDAVKVVQIDEPPDANSLKGCVAHLSSALGIPPASSIRELVQSYRAQQTNNALLVLLLDRLDNYAWIETPNGNLAREWLNHLEAARREVRGLGICAVGGVGALSLQDTIGSAFVSRAHFEVLKPFEVDELEELARPFRQSGRALSESTMDTVRLVTGGIPLLAAYAFQHLWDVSEPTEAVVVEAFSRFNREHKAFVRGVRSTLDTKLTKAPYRVWKIVQQQPGPVPRSELGAACAVDAEGVTIDVDDALELLSASGLIRLETEYNADPVVTYPIASILSFITSPGMVEASQERIVDNLSALLGRFYDFGADFHQGKGDIVCEQVFSATIAVGLGALGWKTEREAIQAAGRTDVRVSHKDRPSSNVVIEVKIWQRNDYCDTHRQVLAYTNHESDACAVVMVRDGVKPGWEAEYASKVLGVCSYERRPTPRNLVAHLVVSERSAQGRQLLVHHFLLSIPRR